MDAAATARETLLGVQVEFRCVGIAVAPIILLFCLRHRLRMECTLPGFDCLTPLRLFSVTDSALLHTARIAGV
jgi:hypothetical protein